MIWVLKFDADNYRVADSDRNRMLIHCIGSNNNNAVVKIYFEFFYHFLCNFYIVVAHAKYISCLRSKPY